MPTPMFFRRLPFALAGACLVGALTVQSAQATTITFMPGTYALAQTNLGAAVDSLVVSVSGGIATFVLSGVDNATFSLPDVATPTGAFAAAGYNPYFYVPGSTITTSYDSAMYPYLTFYSTADLGGFSVSKGPGDTLANLIDTFPSIAGTAQLFTVSSVPESTTWMMMIAGFAIVGGAMRVRSRTVRFAIP